MREDFRCGACGRNFDIQFEGKEKKLACPACKQEWKIESGPFGFFRMYMWL